MTASAPDVTVLIPAYNRARFLPAAIESCLAQDYPRLGVLVLDDGSTDETPELLARFADEEPERFRWRRHENVGQAQTLNRGFAMVDSELICMLSSDDELLPGAVAKLVAALEREPGALVAFCDCTLIDEQGAKLEDYNGPDFDAVTGVRLHECPIGPGATFRRRVLQQVGGWDTELRYCSDFDFWIRVSLCGSFVHLRERLARMRRHSGSLTHGERGVAMALERLRLVEKLYARDDLPAALLAVKEEAYRNAFFVAGTICGAEVNRPGDRFVVADTLAPRTVSRHPDPFGTIAQQEAELRRFAHRLEALEAELEEARGVGRMERDG